DRLTSFSSATIASLMAAMRDVSVSSKTAAWAGPASRGKTTRSARRIAARAVMLQNIWAPLDFDVVARMALRAAASSKIRRARLRDRIDIVIEKPVIVLG